MKSGVYKAAVSYTHLLRILKSKLYQRELEKRMELQNELEGQKKKIEWGSQIRSYTLHPYKLVKDHRTGQETSDKMCIRDRYRRARRRSSSYFLPASCKRTARSRALSLIHICF